MIPLPHKKNSRVYAAYSILASVALFMVSDFVFRAVVLAFEPNVTDFSEVYTCSWLWRNGQNFCRSALVEATRRRLVGASTHVAPIYPPTTFALLSPFTFLPWGWANLVWLTLSLVGVGATIFLLWRIGGSRAWNLGTMFFVTFLLSFDPLHQAFHLGNVALVVVPLVLWSILLAERRQDWMAGLIVGIAICLKPQIAIWVLFYYVLQYRKRVFFGALISGTIVTALLLLHPIQLLDAIPDYRANLHYWFDPGRPFGFTTGALPFHVNIIQIVLYQLVHSVFAANLIAHGLFMAGVIFWILTLFLTKFRIPAPLAISSILALSFLSLYHSVSDVTILTLALCWAIPAKHEAWTNVKVATCVLFFLMMLPGHSLLMRISPHLPSSVTTAWWWNLFIARYFVWLLFALSLVLLRGLLDFAQTKTVDSRPRPT